MGNGPKEGALMYPDAALAVQFRVEMGRRLSRLDTDNSNATKLGGVYVLGLELQRRLNMADDVLWSEEFKQSVSNNGVEVASRVPITMVDGREDVDLGYEAGNLNAWLINKGLEVTVGEPSRLYPDWGGVVEVGWHDALYFEGQPISPQGMVVAAENLAVKLSNLAEDANINLPGGVEWGILNLAASVQTAVAAEIRCAADGVDGLSADQIKNLIGPALGNLGMVVRSRGE